MWTNYSNYHLPTYCTYKVVRAESVNQCTSSEPVARHRAWRQSRALRATQCAAHSIHTWSMGQFRFPSNWGNNVRKSNRYAAPRFKAGNGPRRGSKVGWGVRRNAAAEEMAGQQKSRTHMPERSFVLVARSVVAVCPVTTGSTPRQQSIGAVTAYIQCTQYVRSAEAWPTRLSVR